MHHLLLAPFAEAEAMRRALIGLCAIALGGAPVGVFLMLRRMSLIGDAMAHAILPGAAIAYLIAGLSVFAMAAGGLIAGFMMVLCAGLVARTTEVKEDASLAAVLLISLALGVALVTGRGNNEDLTELLFGSALTLTRQTLVLIVSAATVSLFCLALMWRPLVLECVDPGFLRAVSRAGAPTHFIFLALVVINLVGGFYALGTLLAVGMMIVPAVISRFWARDITVMTAVAVAGAALSGYGGLLLSYHSGIPSGAAVTLVAGALYALSVLIGPVGGWVWQRLPRRHLEA